MKNNTAKPRVAKKIFSIVKWLFLLSSLAIRIAASAERGLASSTIFLPNRSNRTAIVSERGLASLPISMLTR